MDYWYVIDLIVPTVLVSTGGCQRSLTEFIASVIRQPTGAIEGATDSSRVDQFNLYNLNIKHNL